MYCKRGTDERDSLQGNSQKYATDFLRICRICVGLLVTCTVSLYSVWNNTVSVDGYQNGYSLETDINTDTIWRQISIRIQYGDGYQYGYNLETDINTDTIWRRISIRIQFGDRYQYGYNMETDINTDTVWRRVLQVLIWVELRTDM